MNGSNVLNVDGIPHYIIPMKGDGGCLFYSISYLLYGTDSQAHDIRREIVQHVSNNWVYYQPISARPDGDNYESIDEYVADMCRSGTYGTTCELVAAARVYHCQFEVYTEDATLLEKFGDFPENVKRLRFSGDLFAGHFDVLMSATYEQQNIHLHTQSPISLTSPNVAQLSLSCTSRRGKKRRSTVTHSIRIKQLKKAAEVYRKKNIEGRKAALDKYAEQHPEVHRAYVRKYSQKCPEVHRAAVQKYLHENPEVNRAAVRKYTKTNPDVNKRATNKYAEKRKAHKGTNKKRFGFEYNADIDYANDNAVRLGNLTNICKWCKAKKWPKETAGMCCSSGKVQLPDFDPLPEPLCSLITGNHPHSEHFLSSIRKYNASFQMTSFGAKEIKEGNFMPTFKVQGQVYHLIGSLVPTTDQQPVFLQIYFVGGGEHERDIRCSTIQSLRPGLVLQLQDMLHDTNVYVREFKAVLENVAADTDFNVIIDANQKPADAHRGRFNTPVVREVAAIIAGQAFERRDIVIRSKTDQLTRICETHPAYDTLQYPLMFCRGEDGYNIQLPQRHPETKVPLAKTVSAADFYSFRIMIREGQINHLLYFRNLFNQFLVDMYAKIETERLQFIRHNQSKLRVDEYVHLKDAVSNRDAQVSEIGKMVLLPSTFTGGPRYMHERTQDAMTYVRHYGKPDLFITFTCNPKWSDITENLYDGQQAYHRHDLVSRVFHLKLKQAMDLLTKRHMFGSVRCHMFSVEWQKRGLPHAHILVWLQDRITPDQIDNVISAEIPNPTEDVQLYEIVKANMIHGPCGPLNSNSPCMVKNVCSKRYPRPLLTSTQTGDDGYPKYRRRSVEDGGFVINMNGVDIDNRWVVPYNPVLLRTFEAHINVEYCNSVQSIKYICKYINKGSDQAAFALKNDNDEISKYETGRYISSSEAVWRILCFPIHERFPSVMHLSVHLENGQRVYFTEGNVAEKVANPNKTTLMAFFDICKVDVFAKTLLYCEIPSYFVWRNRNFYRRKQGEAVPGYPGVKRDAILGRVYTVHPNNAECYYLRLLLHEVRGPTCFADLKTIDGIVHPTFQSACKALGLLEDDGHWHRTLEDAAISDSPYKLRELFAIMLVFCQLADPLHLWEMQKGHLAEDIQRQMDSRCEGDHIRPDIAYNECLMLVENIVISISGKHLKQYGLPEPSRSCEFTANRAYLTELAYDHDDLLRIISEKEPRLNLEQRHVYDKVLQSVTFGEGRFLFLDAPGGTGKTFLINLLLAKVRETGSIAIAVASSGIAATLLDGGKTAHSAFKLPLNLNFEEQAVCNISKQSDTAKVLRRCKLIVWDECTMSHKGAIEAVDRTLRDLQDSTALMGGITMLLAGDFRQTLPVVPRGTRADEIKACLKSSHLWPRVETLTLRKNMRVHEEAGQFAELLLQIGEGKLEEREGEIQLTDRLCHVVNHLQELTEIIYPGIDSILHKPVTWLRSRAVLTAKNDRASDINNFLLEKFTAESMTYKSTDSVLEVEDAVHYPVEFLQSLDPSGFPPHKLTLKVGAPVMLLRNLKPPELCNGTRLQVKTLRRNVVEATIFTGCGQGETVFIPRIPLIPSDYPFAFKRVQFPLKVCFAMTINKAQGQTFELAGLDLRDDCFSHGQLYVACSRVSTPKSLVILQPKRATPNVVYKEILH